MIDEHHEDKLLETYEKIKSDIISKKLTVIHNHHVNLKQQRDNGLDIKRYAISSWEEGVALCVMQMNETKQQQQPQQKHFELRELQLAPIILYFERDAVKNIFFEVRTGEGKTMINSIIAAVNVLRGLKVDIITTTDVLAVANNNEMKNFYTSLGINSTTNVQSDAHTYEQDIVYGTMFHFGKDFLKDGMKRVACGLCARPHHLCIIDEVDLLAIDTADQSVKVAKPFPGMEMMDDIYRAIFGSAKVSAEEFKLRLQRLPKHLQEYCERMKPIWEKHPKSCRIYFNKYIIEDDKVVPIDPQSGMIMHGAVFSDGLQQLLEVKRNYPITPTILNAITLSNYGYIQMYDKLCGLTATLGDDEELKLLMKVFSGAEHYRIPASTKSKLVDESGNKRLSNIMYRSKATGNILYQSDFLSQPDEVKFIKILFTQEKKNDSFVYYACAYKKNEFTSNLTALNERMTGYSYPDRAKYIQILTKKIMRMVKNNNGKKIILLNLKDDLAECIANNSDCVNLNDLSKLDDYRNDIKLYVFDMKFDAQRVSSNGSFLMYAACNLVNIENIIEHCLAQERSLLIICHNRGDLKKIRAHISHSHEDKIIQYVGFAEEGSLVIDTINPIAPGKIILTTLIGSRGTDYQITDELNDNGGLHVVCTFIPRNKRIRQQVFGRAARNGRRGSAQICPIYGTRVINDIEAALTERHQTYLNELKANEEKFQEIMFFHSLHAEFREFIRRLGNTTNEMKSIMIEDLTEYWAFWLKYKEIDQLNTAKPEDMLQQFLNEAKHIISFTGYHNPVYAAQRANYYFSKGEHKTASELIKTILRSAPDSNAFCEALILEVLNFARFAIITDNERELAKQLLSMVKINQCGIRVDHYLEALNVERGSSKQRIQDTIETKTISQSNTKPSLLSAGSVAAASVIAASNKSPDCILYGMSTINHLSHKARNVSSDIEACGKYIGEACNQDITDKKSAITACAIGLVSAITFSESISGLVDAFSKVSLELSETQQVTDLKDIEMILKKTINGIIEARFGDEPIVVSHKELQRICKDLNEADHSIILLSSIDKNVNKWYFKKCFDELLQQQIKEKILEIENLVELLCAKIKESSNKALQQTTTSISIEDIKVLFGCVPYVFMNRAHNQIDSQLAIKHDIVRGGAN